MPKWPYLAAGLFVLAAALPALAQSGDPDWLEQLRLQASELQRCEIAYLMNVREGQLGAKETYEARIQCEDGRMFDVSRIGRYGFFGFKACDARVC